MTQTEPNNPFTRDLLRSLVATTRTPPNETEAEYAERFAAVTDAWAAFRPRGPWEQMLAAQIVGAHHAALDCLNRAMETEDPALADRQRRSHAMMTRTMRDMVRLLERKQQEPADTEAPPLAIEPIPPIRRRPPEPKPAQHPMHREKAPAEDKDPSKMTDDELDAALKAMRAQVTVALFDKKHPNHKDALRLLPEMLPGVIVPETMLEPAEDGVER